MRAAQGGALATLGPSAILVGMGKVQHDPRRAPRTTGVVVAASAVSVLACVTSCGPRVIPATAENEFDVERIEQACEQVEPGAHYAIRPTNVLLKERKRQKIGIGAFGLSLSFPVPREPDARLGVYQGEQQQLTAVRSWDAASDGFTDEFVLATSAEPLGDPAVRVDVRDAHGAIGYARVHVCSLLTDKYVGLSDGEGDVAFEVTKLPRGERSVDVRVDGRASPPSDERMCAGPHGAGVMLLPGQRATIQSVRGGVSFGTFDHHKYGPAGVAGKWQSYRYDGLSWVNHGALAFRAFGQVAVAKSGTTVDATEAGCLAFFVNDTDPDNNDGGFVASVKIAEL